MGDSDANAARSGTVQSLRAATVDDGVIRLGPVRVELLSAAEEAQAVELLAALFAGAVQRQATALARRVA